MRQTLTVISSYARIVHRVFTEAEPAEKEDAGKLLGWLVCAKRPLKWHEIQGAWSFNTDTRTFDYEERRLRTDSKELCGSLVEIHHGGVIDLVHLTAKQYVNDSLPFPVVAPIHGIIQISTPAEPRGKSP
jgi:hypothetical protein